MCFVIFSVHPVLAFVSATKYVKQHTYGEKMQILACGFWGLEGLLPGSSSGENCRCQCWSARGESYWSQEAEEMVGIIQM